jgi:hypothetical protein
MLGNLNSDSQGIICFRLNIFSITSPMSTHVIFKPLLVQEAPFYMITVGQTISNHI